MLYETYEDRKAWINAALAKSSEPTMIIVHGEGDTDHDGDGLFDADGDGDGAVATLPDATKVGPHGYTHGWVKVDPGSDQAGRQLNELAGLTANHSNEAAGAVDRARMAASEGRYDAASGHLGNAAFLLHAAGHHGLAQAAEGARDNFAGVAPPIRHPAAPHASHGSFTSPAPPSSIRDFEAAMMMPSGFAPVGSHGGEMAVGAPVRAKGLNVFGTYEEAKLAIDASKLARWDIPAHIKADPGAHNDLQGSMPGKDSVFEYGPESTSQGFL